MFVRNDSARVEVKWLSSSRDSQGLFGYVTIFVRKLVILVFNTHENDGTIPRSERRDFEEWRHDGKIEKTYLPLTTAKSKFREQHLWQLHATFTPTYWSVSQRLMDSKVRARLDFYMHAQVGELLCTRDFFCDTFHYLGVKVVYNCHRGGIWENGHPTSHLSSELTARLLSTRSERRDRCAVKKKVED